MSAVQQLEKLNMDITAVQEIRWLDSGNIKISKSTILYSGSRNNKHEFGTGFVLKQHLVKNIISFKAINERLAYIRLKGNWYNYSFISAHAPTEEKEEDIKDEFYEQLDTLIGTIPKHDMLILCGDMNAQVGREPELRPTIGMHSLHQMCNDNGLRFVELASANDMLIKSTMFEHKQIHKQSWISNDGITKSQIDHIAIDARHASNILDVRSMRGAEGDTDHLLVRAKIRMKISTWKDKRTDPEAKWNVDKLKDEENQKLFEAELRKREQQTNNQDELTVEDKWNIMKNNLIETTKSVVGEKPKNKTKRWFDRECENKIEERDKLRQINLQHNTDETNRKYQESRKETRKLFRRKKRDQELKELEELESDNRFNRTKDFFMKTAKFKKGFQPHTENILLQEDGSLITNQDEVLRRWKQHFEDLLNNQEQQNTDKKTFHTADLPVEPPSLREVKIAIAKLKNGKAPGSDNIPSEILRYGGDLLHRSFHDLILNIWETEIIPEEWKESIIIPIHKKGSKMICKNYRGISLISTSYKVLTNILLHRLTPYAEGTIGEYQCGFRPRRSTTDQIFTLRMMLEKCWEFNTGLHHLFIDFKQAYDCVKRVALWEAMAEFSIPTKLIRLTEMCVSGARSRVRVGVLSDCFPANSGLRQGDALSPLLFNIALEKVIRDAEMELVVFSPMGPHLLLAYADDIDIIEKSVRGVKEMFVKIEKEADKMGLGINEEKTKYMCISRQQNRDRVGQNVTMGEYNFERVNRFKYLGVTITEDNNITEELKGRILSASRCLFAMDKVLRPKILLRATKIKIYKSIIRPILMYGCETWTMTKQNERKLRCFERKILRKIFGATQDTITGLYRRRKNAELKELFQEPDIVQEIKSRRLRWLGHIERHPETRFVKMVWSENPSGKRPLGRPRLRWRDNILSDLKIMGYTYQAHMTEDRQEWRKIVNAAKTHPGL